MVLHALEPPPPEETDELGAPMEPPVVIRLVTTLSDNLRFLQSQRQQHRNEQSEWMPLDINSIYRATIGASGAAGSLGVFLVKGEGDYTREMLMQLPPPHPPQLDEVNTNNTTAASDASTPEPLSAILIDFILQHVAMYDQNIVPSKILD